MSAIDFINGSVQNWNEASSTKNYTVGTTYRDYLGRELEYRFFSGALSQGWLTEVYSQTTSTDGKLKKHSGASTTACAGGTVCDVAAQQYAFVAKKGIFSMYASVSSLAENTRLMPATATAGTTALKISAFAQDIGYVLATSTDATMNPVMLEII